MEAAWWFGCEAVNWDLGYGYSAEIRKRLSVMEIRGARPPPWTWPERAKVRLVEVEHVHRKSNFETGS